MDVRFLIDTDRLTVNDMCLIEDIQSGTRPVNNWRSVMARFLVDENGKLMDEEKALKVIGRLSMTQFSEAQEAFVGAIQRKAVPPKKSAS